MKTENVDYFSDAVNFKITTAGFGQQKGCSYLYSSRVGDFQLLCAKLWENKLFYYNFQ
jgi:hypothetical protein